MGLGENCLSDFNYGVEENMLIYILALSREQELIAAFCIELCSVE